MPTRCFNWLHLTDLHFGLSSQQPIWPNLRDRFFDNLESMDRQCGPWHAVLFTGDFVQSGAQEDFEALDDKVLKPLWERFRALGSNPVLLAVPGNHDLMRPESKKAAVRQLTIERRFTEVADEFWNESECEYRTLIEQAFRNYARWWSQTPYCSALQIQQGLLPGDFSTTVSTPDGLLIGIVGLNTTFLQLVDGDFEGRLAWDVKQLHEVCSGDAPGWCGQKDACILLTHQPPTWLDEKSQNAVYPEINPAGRFAVHLFGHMHENVIRTSFVGAGKAVRQWQGCSLFGLERFGNPPQEERRHGYSGGKLEFSKKKANVRHWPRKAVRGGASGWRFERDVESCELSESDGGTRPEEIDYQPANLKQDDSKEIRIQRLILNMDVAEADDRRTAIIKLGETGSEAKRATANLIRAFQDSDEEVRSAAGEAVVRIGETVIPSLLKSLSHKDPCVRGRAAAILGRFAPTATQALQGLIALLEDEHTGVRRTAAVSVGNFGAEAHGAVLSLTTLLNDPDRDTKRHTAEALGKMGSEAKEAVGTLAVTLNKETDKEVRWSICYALGRIGPAAADAVPALTDALEDSDSHLRQLAAEALGNIGSNNEDAVRALVKTLQDTEGLVCSFAARSLGIIRSSSGDVIDALCTLLHSDNALVAAWALGEIGPAARNAISILTEVSSQSHDEGVRQVAADAVKKIGANHKIMTEG